MDEDLKESVKCSSQLYKYLTRNKPLYLWSVFLPVVHVFECSVKAFKLKSIMMDKMLSVRVFFVCLLLH